MTPIKGSLERILFDKLIERGIEGVTASDFEGTGITEDNIDQLINNLRNGMYAAEEDNQLKVDA